MKWTWVLLISGVAFAFAGTGHAIPKCHKASTCGDTCHQEGGEPTIYKQCQPYQSQQKASEDKCGLGVPDDDQCGKIFSGSHGVCPDATSEKCGGNYYKSGACTSA
jgi:hypothetical protein